MAVVPLTKIHICVPKKDKETLITCLRDLGCTEIIKDASFSKTEALEEAHQTHLRFAQVEAIRAFYERYYDAGFVRTTFEGARAYTTASELAGIEDAVSLDALQKEVEEHQTALADIRRRIRTAEEGLHTLHAWERLDLPLNTITETASTKTVALRASEKALRAWIDTTTVHYGEMLEIQEASSTTALVTYLKRIESTLNESLGEQSIEVVALPHATHTAREEIARLTTEKRDAEQALKTREEMIVTIAKDRVETLKKLSDATRWKREHSDAVAELATTERTVHVSAWVPTAVLSTLGKTLTESVPASAYVEVPLAEDETVPTLMDNHVLVKPFESVTNLYGTPYHKDLDPTSPLAFFFILFFGFCLSDAGYGLILTLITGTLLAKYHLEEGVKQFITLFFYGGISTLIIGALFGGYFGIDLGALTTAIPSLSFLLAIQQFDPINNPLPVFYTALILGFIQIVFGITLSLIRKAKNGDLRAGILDDGPWLALFSLATVYGLAVMGFLGNVLASYMELHGTTLFIVAVVLIVLTQGRKESNPIMKLLIGLLGLYGIVGYFADMLSYSRLMALGLATGALAFSINSIALFAAGDSFGIGTFIMIFVLIFGHTLNIAISLLGTFINSARLQFVEFFSKFSTGTGKAFTPLKKEPREVIVLPESTSSP